MIRVRPGFGRFGSHPPRPLALPVRPAPPGRDEPLPAISVVVPSFQQGAFLDTALRSLREQDYPRLEIILVDGGSTDDTRQVIERHAASLHWWVSEPDGGQAHAINKGFGHASGEIMGWLNSDDALVPGALTRIARHFRDHPATDVVYGHRILIDPGNREIGRWVLPPHAPAVLKWLAFIPQETMYWRRAAWQRVGAAVDESLHFALDWDLALRFAAAGCRLTRLPWPLGLFRVHPQQKTCQAMPTTGTAEIRRLRQRELGFTPSRWRLAARSLPYLVRARLAELRSVSPP